MTPSDLDDRIAELVAAARDAGVSDETIIEVLTDNAKALAEGLS